LGSVSSLVSEKRICEISANQSITAVHRLTLDPLGKCSNAFSETKNMIKAKMFSQFISFREEDL
jgi:hypothetical protein